MIHEELRKVSQVEETIEVGISNEIVTLLSQQLYQSPLKAIEELIVNSYDADASRCHVYTPDTSLIQPGSVAFLAIYDDGIGLSAEGMKNLWHVGRSDKRNAEIAKLRKRKQIGKFGIGKLAVSVEEHSEGVGHCAFLKALLG